MGLPPDGLQAWASRGRRGALGASGVFGGVVNGNFSGVWGIRGDTEGLSEGTVPRDDRSRPLKGRGALEGSFVLWKKGRRRGRERMDWSGRTVGRGYSRVGGAGARDSPPTSCSLGLYLATQLLAILGQLAQLLMALLEMGSLGLHQTQHLGTRWAGGRPFSFPGPSCYQQAPPHPHPHPHLDSQTP